MSQETELRTRRHHQHHGLHAPDQVKRHETLDPVRTDAVDPRFHGVGSRPILMINLKLTRHTVLVVLM